MLRSVDTWTNDLFRQPLADVDHYQSYPRTTAPEGSPPSLRYCTTHCLLDYVPLMAEAALNKASWDFQLS